NQTEAIFGSTAYGTRLLADLAAAQHEILLDYYVLGGNIGTRVARTLAERQKAGVTVQVLLDSHCGTVPRLRKEGRAALAVLKDGQVPCRWGLSRPGGWLLHPYTEDHNKLVVIDGQVAYTGSANLSDSFSRFNDLMVRVVGPAVADLRALFVFDWAV